MSTVDRAVQAVAHVVRLGLNNRFYGVVMTQEHRITTLSPEEWTAFLDRIDRLIADYRAIRVSQDFLGEYAKSKVHTHLTHADYDHETDTLRVILSGSASVPLHLQVFDEMCQERVIACEPFDGRLEKHVRLSASPVVREGATGDHP
jgi:hypothetical protein